jgi:hypothetical protein
MPHELVCQLLLQCCAGISSRGKTAANAARDECCDPSRYATTLPLSVLLLMLSANLFFNLHACNCAGMHLAVLQLVAFTQCNGTSLLGCSLSGAFVAALWAAGQRKAQSQWRHQACSRTSRRCSEWFHRCRPCSIQEGAPCLAELPTACAYLQPHALRQAIDLALHSLRALRSVHTLLYVLLCCRTPSACISLWMRHAAT